MDAYLPTLNTFAPSAYVADIGEIWDRVHGTRTVIYRYGEARPTTERLLTSSLNRTFFFNDVDSPELAGLERLRSFQRWGENWDAEGSAAPNPEILDAASRVFSLLSVHAVPQVTLTPEGLPAFLYEGATSGEVIVTGPMMIDYFFTGDGPFDDDVDISADILPTALIEQLTKLTA